MKEKRKDFVTMSQLSLFGPFSQMLTMRNLPIFGPIHNSQLEIIQEAGLVVQQGKIVAVGDFQTLQSSGLYQEVGLSGGVVVPGWIDCHTHLCFGGSRAKDYASRLEGKTYLEIAKAGGGILDTVRKTREASEQSLFESMKVRANRLLRHGVTTCEIKSGYGLSVESELKMLRCVQSLSQQHPIHMVSTCLSAHIKPPEFQVHSDYLDFILHEILPVIQKERLSGRVDIFVEEEAFGLEMSKKFLTQASEMGFDLVLHADQFSRGGALLASEVHALSADHLEVSEESDFHAMKKAGVIPVVLPGASLGLGLPFAKARQMLDLGLPLVIASDWNPGSAPMGHLLLQASLLSAFERLSMAETLAAITVRAANALKLQDRGVLDVGNQADFQLYDCDDYREILYQQGMLAPSQVVIGGKTQW